MKYGENFARESVPEWSLHNIDYNSLKYFIKAHTTKDEAKAIAIPGQPDTHLARVENELYHELCAQHDSAGLFVTAKAEEINRRLQHLSNQIHGIILRCANSDPSAIPRKRRRKCIKLEREVIQCGDDIQHLRRFVNAQEEAFRKILKKYKKWTGSNSLGARFKEDVLTQPKSFTRRDFHPLQLAFEELLTTVQSSTPMRSLPESPVIHDTGSVFSEQELNARQSLRRVTIQTEPPRIYAYDFSTEQSGYWNEYENGSENGDMADDYVIYLNPEDNGSPDLKSVLNALATPFTKARSWIKARKPEHESLLSRESSNDMNYGATHVTIPSLDSSYFTSPPGRAPPSSSHGSNTAIETDAEDDLEADVGYSSSEEFPAGYEAYYASLPSINDQRINQYKDRVMFLATSGLFAMSFMLLGIATVLVTTARHKLRAEVDAVATLGSVVSIGCGCIAFALAMARWDVLNLANRLLVGVTFTTISVLNGFLLVLVMGNTAL